MVSESRCRAREQWSRSILCSIAQTKPDERWRRLSRLGEGGGLTVAFVPARCRSRYALFILAERDW